MPGPRAQQDHYVALNARVYQSSTNGEAPTFAECMVVKDSIIQHVGAATDHAVATARAAGAHVRDMQGHTVLPGFIDGHLHLLLVGQSLNKVSLDDCRSLDDIRTVIAQYARAHPHVSRIFCRGWMHSMTPAGVDASLLDDLDSRPIFVDTKDLHSTWCNTPGLREACRVMNISSDTPDPAGGNIQRDAAGQPNGVFNESAVFQLMWPFVARVTSVDERKEAIKAAFTAFNAAGYTGMIDMAMDDNIWEPLMELRNSEGAFNNMRVAAYWLMKPEGSLDQVLAQVDRVAALAKQFHADTTPDCRIVGVKVICDGIVDACTASLTEPYSTGQHPDPIWRQEVLDALVARAHTAGLQVALHAIGDSTIRMAIDVLERNTDRSRRPRIEHLELASAHDAARLGKLGITASIQPVHSDPAILRAWPRLIGPQRCERAFAYRDFADGGAPLALGSDAPTAPHQPLPNLYVATTRRSFREPELETVVNAEFALSIGQAVAGATHGSAYSCFADRWTGSLRPGLKADFVVCQVELTPDKLVQGRVMETWFEGKKVYPA
ncbi:amidohydrolase family protein [Hirsutella rhossiliensis]|uniref:Amidohydrolase family domain-containing protein n=1 Tax=Hirsutella rhossiliensis TaxID=111463 RepID=A0A9P8SGT1_9HYPO|nr:amidohydrolase family domain-containing protein [Hirsutella rhossiliensis]KAH0960276.1 amidohydrolase family domain-containing protein [Hirsutella rhossiliensis]